MEEDDIEEFINSVPSWYYDVVSDESPSIYQLYEDELPSISQPIRKFSPIKNKIIPKYGTYKPRYRREPFKYIGYNSGVVEFKPFNLSQLDRDYLQKYHSSDIKILNTRHEGRNMLLIGWEGYQPIMEDKNGIIRVLPTNTRMEVEL